MNITFLIIFGLSVLIINTIIAAIEELVKDEFSKGEDKKMTQKTFTLDEFLNERGDFVKQVVYKIDGDYIGDIKGKNVTVILMGDGDFKGDVNSKNGTVFLNKGNVIGDIKANKVLCPIPPTKYNSAKGVKSPTSQTKNKLTCFDCIHCHLGFETMYCSASNKVIRRLTPCVRFEEK